MFCITVNNYFQNQFFCLNYKIFYIKIMNKIVICLVYESKLFRLFFLLVFLSSHTVAQENVLDNYIKQGLENNLALQQKQTSYKKSLEALKEAKALFLPDISLNARYTVAGGGRIIEFPVGDMLNGVYSSLNVLSAIHGLTDPATGEPTNFPQMENMQFRFYRPYEHETKLRMIQPVFNPQIYYNSKIRTELTNAEKADLKTFKRSLIAEIKTAYYNYLKTVKLNELLGETKKLLLENIRVNEKLFENDKITIDIVYRSKSELSKFEQQMTEAEKGVNMARAYFNFLLNRELTSNIVITDQAKMLINFPDVITSEENAVNRREELDGLRSYEMIARNNIRLNKSNKLPTLFAAFDYGFQGEKYRFTIDDDFVMASLVLKWDIFKGYGNKAKISGSELDKIMIDNKQKETENQIRLQVINSYYDLESAIKSIESSVQQKLSAEKAFKLVNRKYIEGLASLLEFLDARATLTNSSVNLIITNYDYLIKYAEYEKVTAMYLIEN